MLIALFVFLILILLFLRFSVFLEYSGDGFSGCVKFLFFKFKFPKAQKKATSKKEDGKDNQKKIFGNFSQLKSILSPIAKTMGKLIRMLSVNLLVADVKLGSEDAFNTAMSYGAACASVGMIFPFLDSRIKIKKKQISINADFENMCSTIYLYTNISLRIWQITVLALYLVYQYIKNMKGFDKNGRTRT